MDRSTPRALIFADRLGAELRPLTATLSVALLPVVGKELLIYTIEELAAAGYRELIIVTAFDGEQRSASSLGDGARWGLHIRYVLSRGEETPSAVRRRLSLGADKTLLVLRGDLLRTPVLAAFLARSPRDTGHCIVCSPTDPRGSLLLIRTSGDSAELPLDVLDWQQPVRSSGAEPFTLDDFRCYPLDDLAEFHRANLDLLGGRIPGLGPSGAPIALGLIAEPQARVSPRSLKQGMAYVGAGTRVHPEAELLGEVVLGANVIIDRAATIRDSVILPRTYVGELLEIGNAIVAGNHLLRVDTGARLKLSEAFLLGDLGTSDRRALGSRLDRLAGLMLLILSLPLWPLAVLAAARHRRGGLLLSRVLIGNRPTAPAPSQPAGSFVERVWNTRIPLLRNLPRLLALARGDLRLVGVSALTPPESLGRDEDWQRVRDLAPVGLIGPTQLNLSADATLAERLLSDAFYARDQSLAHNLRLLLSAAALLFRRETWQSPP